MYAAKRHCNHFLVEPVRLVAFTTLTWFGVSFYHPAAAYDVTQFVLTPNPANDRPADKIAQVPKSDAPEEAEELVNKIFLPRNDKLQQFDFEAQGKYTGRDIENRDFEKETMAIQVDWLDIQTDRAGIALTVLFGAPGNTKKSIMMSSFQGEVPLTPATKEGDTWKLKGSFQLGCTADGKVFGPTGSKVNRFSGEAAFRGDRAFKTPRIECEAAAVK